MNANPSTMTMASPPPADLPSQASARGRHAERLLLGIFLGTAFVLNGFLAGFFYPDNPLVGDFSAMIGAVLLAAPVLRTAVLDLLKGKLRMNELVALAVLAAMVQGDFKTAGVVAFFMLISMVLETRTAEGAHASIESLIRLTPARARRLTKDGDEEVPATDLHVGDRIRVLPGEAIPADGEILSGKTTLNESTITGESLPADKGPSDTVFAGTQNLTGAVEISVTHTGQDTTIGKVRELILAAEQTKLPIMMLIDRYVAYYTPVVLMLAGMVWFFTNEWDRVIALLVISCPGALILATPTAMVAALSAAARLGILVKDVTDLEAAGRIDAMVFDKTGTLTTGELGVSRLSPREGVSPSDLLYAAASAEQLSNHPAAHALQRLAAEVDLELAEPEHLQEEPGLGISARVDQTEVLAGRAAWLRSNGISATDLDESGPGTAEGLSMIFVARAGEYVGWIGLDDKLRAEARETIVSLEELKIRRISMVTGDRDGVARAVADQIGCREYRAACLPEEKVDFVRSVQRDGFRVAVVGDGVNDAPALAAGDTGIAMGAAGSDVAIHSASVALMSNDLRRLPFLIRLSRSARTMTHQNLLIGALFIAGGLVLSGLGKLEPIDAALMHWVGVLIVVFNSARLIREGEELESAAAAIQVAGHTDASTAALLNETS